MKWKLSIKCAQLSKLIILLGGIILYIENVKIFREYIKSFNIHIIERKFGRETIFEMESILPWGYKSLIISIFQEIKPTFFDIFCINGIKVDNQIMGKVCLRINELNLGNALVKFVIDEDGDLTLSYNLNVNVEFRPDELLDHMFILDWTMKNEFEGLLELIYGNI